MRQKPGGRQGGDAAGVAVGRRLEGDPTAERVAGQVRTVESLVVEEGLEHVAQDLGDRAPVGHQVGRAAVAGQVDEDHLAVHGQVVEHRVPGLAAVGEPVDQDQRLAATVPFAGEHAFSVRCRSPTRAVSDNPDGTYL